MNGDITADEARVRKKRFSSGQLALIVVFAILVTAGATYWAIKTFVFPDELSPVTLSAKEERRLEGKLNRLGWQGRLSSEDDQALEPEPYAEREEDREISLTEKELNSLVGRNPEWSDRVAIDLADNLASAKMLIPIPQDFPVMAGSTLRVNAGLELAYTGERPVVTLKGVSVMGVPLPNAWLGNLKNVDLVQEFGAGPGFWRSFAAGIEQMEVRDGELFIKLRE